MTRSVVAATDRGRETEKTANCVHYNLGLSEVSALHLRKRGDLASYCIAL